MPRPPDLKDILRRYEPTKLGFIFDFDGTLADLRDDPAAVDLSQEVIHALARLHQATNESVFVLSGRPMDFLESIFGAHIHLIAEHGAQSSLKLPGLPPPKRPMPPEARQFLQELTTQNPGSFIETKRTSLVWHYRPIRKKISPHQVRDYQERLTDILESGDYACYNFTDVLEVKPKGFQKSAFVVRDLLPGPLYDHFVLAFGDDEPESEVFRLLKNDRGLGFAVGTKIQNADFSFEKPRALREWLLAGI